MAANGKAKLSDLDGQEPESTDYANYFCTYSYLYHQVGRAHGVSCRLAAPAE